MSFNVNLSLGGRRPQVEERIIVTPRQEIIEERFSGPYGTTTRDIIINENPRGEIIERVIIGNNRREIIEERVIERPGDSYPRQHYEIPYPKSGGSNTDSGHHYELPYPKSGGSTTDPGHHYELPYPKSGGSNMDPQHIYDLQYSKSGGSKTDPRHHNELPKQKSGSSNTFQIAGNQVLPSFPPKLHKPATATFQPSKVAHLPNLGNAFPKSPVDAPNEISNPRGYEDKPPAYSDVREKVQMMGQPVLPCFSSKTRATPVGIIYPSKTTQLPYPSVPPTNDFPKPQSYGTQTKDFYGWAPPSHCRGTITWMTAANGMVPGSAVVAGVDKDSTTIYAGRAWHHGDLLPAKVTPSHGCAYVSYGGEEIKKFDYEVMISTHVAWQQDVDGRVPIEAIPCGHTADGEKLYMGRRMHDGALTVGKVHPSHRCIYIPYAGREISFKEYEVLILH